MGKIGYLDLYGFDPGTGVAAREGFDADFDALEVLNGMDLRSETIERSLGDWFSILRSGRPMVGTASSDSHELGVIVVGYPRTYVEMGGRSLDEASFIDGVRTGRTVMTTAPLIRLSAWGVPPGGLVAARPCAQHRGGRASRADPPWCVEVEVEVVAASWADVRAVRVLADGSPAAERAVGRDARGRPMLRTVVPVPVTSDTFVVAIAAGEDALPPEVAGQRSGVPSVAITGALYVDADGDGKWRPPRPPPRPIDPVLPVTLPPAGHRFDCGDEHQAPLGLDLE
jgi:hypothetical protein